MEKVQPIPQIIDDWITSKKRLCNCNRGNIQIYYCNVEKCIDREQQYYCEDCVMEDSKHDHAHTFIKEELIERMHQWSELSQDANQLKLIIDANYPQHEPLLKYLENESLLQKPGQNVYFPSHYLSQDIESFYATFNIIISKMGEVQAEYEDKNVRAILNRTSDLIQLQASYEKLKHLWSFKDEEQHETFFYEVYEPILKIAGTSSRQFIDFKQLNYDSLTRLKWRWIDQMFTLSNQGPDEEVKGSEDQLTITNDPQHPLQELQNSVGQLQDKIAHLSSLNQNKQSGQSNKSIDKIKDHHELIDKQEETIKELKQSIILNHQEIKFIEKNFNGIQDQHKCLFERITAQENLIPPLDSRLSALEQIYTSFDFPSSLTLVQQTLDKNLKESISKLGNIENIDKEFDQSAVKKLINVYESNHQTFYQASQQKSDEHDQSIVQTRFGRQNEQQLSVKSDMKLPNSSQNKLDIIAKGAQFQTDNNGDEKQIELILKQDQNLSSLIKTQQTSNIDEVDNCQIQTYSQPADDNLESQQFWKKLSQLNNIPYKSLIGRILKLQFRDQFQWYYNDSAFLLREDQLVNSFIKAENLSKQSIIWLFIKHLREIQSQGNIENIIAFIEYLAKKFKNDSNKVQNKELRIRDVLMDQEDRELLSKLWDRFLETWNASNPMPNPFSQTTAATIETPESFIVFNDEALLSNFIELDDQQLLSLESAVKLHIILITYKKNGGQLQVPQLKNLDSQDLQITTVRTIENSAIESTKVSFNKIQTRNIITFGQSKSGGNPKIEPLDIPVLNDNNIFVYQRILKQATIDSSPLFMVFNFLDILEIGNNKPRQRNFTSLRNLLNITISNDLLKSSMKYFNAYSKDVLFGANKQRNLQQIQIEWSPFSDQLLISVVLALSDRMPSKTYGEAIAIEIARLESVGESIVEHVYVVYSITNPINWKLHFNDLENLRIQTLKVSNLNELARVFNLEQKLVSNQQVKSDGPKRELSAIVNSLVGALGLWAGIEPVVHFLQLLNVIQKDKKKDQEGELKKVKAYMNRTEGNEEEKEGGDDTFSGTFQNEGEHEVRKEEQYDDSEKMVDEIPEFETPEDEKDGKFYHQPQDYMIPKQLYEYLNCLSSSVEIKQIIKKVPQIEEIEQKVAMILFSNEKTQLKIEQKVIYNLALFDSSFNDSLFMETDIGKTQEFLRANVSNLKLKMIGQSFISMMFKVRMYYETANFDDLEIKSAKNIEAQISQIMLASWQSYGISTKFLKISSNQGNIIPLVISDSDSQLNQKISDYEKLIRPPYIINANEKSTVEVTPSKESDNNPTKSSKNSMASTSHSTNHTLKTHTHQTNHYSQLFQDENKKDKVLRQFFTSKPSDEMMEICENFLPEYANVLCGLIGAKFIQSIGSLQKTSKFAQFLLAHNSDHRFPIFQEMKDFYTNLWNANSYSRILKLHYSVENIKGGTEKMLYYKVYIQTLEIRRVKFKLSHTSRHQRIFKDVYQYIELGNKIFQEYQKIVKFPLSPYEYITFHQEYRKIYKVGANFDSLYKLMEPLYSKRKKTENNPFQRIQTFLTNIKSVNKGTQQSSSNKTLTKKMIELLVNQIEADLKKESCRITDNALTGQKELNVIEYLDLTINQLIKFQQYSKNLIEEPQHRDHNLDKLEFFEQLSNELNVARYSHGHLFNEEDIEDINLENFSTKYLFNEKCSNEDVLKLLEHISEQYQ